MVLLSTARKASLRAPTLARSLATPSSNNIGQTKVQMSAFDKGHSINYQRIEDNLQVVRSRSVSTLVAAISACEPPARPRRITPACTWHPRTPTRLPVSLPPLEDVQGPLADPQTRPHTA